MAARAGAAMTEWPTVSVVVPVYNSKATIDACLESLARQDYPLDRLEVVVAEGFSTDGSSQKLLERAALQTLPKLTLVANPKRNTASGLNVGIAVASGEIIVRLDAHSVAPTDYVRRNVEVLLSSGADYIGGRPNNRGVGYWGEAIALAMATRFGVGAHFRTSSRPADVDTVAFGAFRRSTFERLGPFDEDLEYAEDNEYTHRVRKNGGRVYFDPSIQCSYRPRSTLIDLFRQYEHYGWGRMRHAIRDRGGVSVRHLAPMAFVGMLVLFYLDAPLFSFARMALGGLLATYLVVSLVTSFYIALREGLKYFPALPLVFFTLHISYGLGQWHAIIGRFVGRDRGRRRWRKTPPTDEPRIVFVGCVDEGRRSLETLLDMKAEIVAVFTLRPDLAMKVSGAVAWERITSENRIPLHYVANINEPEAVEIMRALRPDVVFCVGWTQLLRREILQLPRLGCVGFHASALPLYRGRAPVNWAIINGERETGNTMMLLDEGVDTGDILAQRRFPIEAHDTCATVYDKVARSEDEMIREVLPLIRQGFFPRTRQDHSKATIMPRRRPADGIIDWHKTRGQLHDWVRALTHPYPGAFTYVGGRRVFVWRARPGGANGTTEPRPGWWRVEGEPAHLVAGTADGDLVLERVQMEGELEIDGMEFGRSRLPAEGVVAGGEVP
jgi:methionyl-tRNA formyltransferase